MTQFPCQYVLCIRLKRIVTSHKRRGNSPRLHQRRFRLWQPKVLSSTRAGFPGNWLSDQPWREKTTCVQEKRRCGTLGHGLVLGWAVLGWQLDPVVSEVFSKLNNSWILHYRQGSAIPLQGSVGGRDFQSIYCISSALINFIGLSQGRY